MIEKIKAYLKSYFRRYGVLALIILVGVFGFFKLRGCDKHKDANNSSLALRPGESEAVIVDPTRHHFTLITKEHVKVFNMPSRPSRVAVLTKGGIKVDSPQIGSEFAPFLGAAYTLEGGTVLAGLDVFYWKRLDVALGLAVDPHLVQHTQAFLGVSYLAWSNCSVLLGVGNKLTPMVGIKVRL